MPDKPEFKFQETPWAKFSIVLRQDELVLRYDDPKYEACILPGVYFRSPKRPGWFRRFWHWFLLDWKWKRIGNAPEK